MPVKTQQNWVSEPHDHDFENRKFDPKLDFDLEMYKSQPQFFLSGLADVKPTSLNMMLPRRHGTYHIGGLQPELGNQVIAFHPTCFDILLRFGWDNLEDMELSLLVRWLSIRISLQLPYHADVRQSYANGNMWHHSPALEYLAANPLFVPRLSSIFEAAVQNHPSFSTHSGAFTSPEVATNPDNSVATTQDPFNLLPLELGLQILGYLVPKDIANLRLSTRAFRQLPIFFFRKLILEEMPWLWEVWSDKPPYIWATVPFAVLEEQRKSLDEVEEACEIYLEVIEEEMPELLPKWKDAVEHILNNVRVAQPDLVAECYAEATRDVVVSLPADKTNWYQLYADIKRHWDELKGLQNRKRIWGEIERFIHFALHEEWRARQLGVVLGYRG
jgi:hypothetical protein